MILHSGLVGVLRVCERLSLLCIPSCVTEAGLCHVLNIRFNLLRLNAITLAQVRKNKLNSSLCVRLTQSWTPVAVVKTHCSVWGCGPVIIASHYLSPSSNARFFFHCPVFSSLHNTEHWMSGWQADVVWKHRPIKLHNAWHQKNTLWVWEKKSSQAFSHF